MNHLDFLGAGHDNVVTVTASSDAGTPAQSTVDGFAIQNTDQLSDASRFLAQASFGADHASIAMTAAMGYEAWLDEQFALPQLSLTDEMIKHGELYTDQIEFAPGAVFRTSFRSAWMTHNLSSPDILRQRLAFNLSQIMVINDNSDFFEDIGQVLSSYYDMLAKNAFGNYQELLYDVSMSPAMGNFLSHYNNPKEDLENNIHPDENYAREIMQLFSIGLWELNSDGTEKEDSLGNFFPTYTNADIKEFAQVFTGLGAGTKSGQFGLRAYELSDSIVWIMVRPMKMYEAHHDTSEKHLLNGMVLPANQSGMEDINQTIDHLCQHPNTAPFISKALIKMMTTSNPSPQYVADVAAAFDPASPGNFQEVIRAILLHPQARDPQLTTEYTFGKLREPLVRMMNYLKAFPLSPNQYGDYRYEMEYFGTNTGQSPLEAPSVFNFFLPEYSPPGPIGKKNLLAPEFQILNATNAVGLVNDVDQRVVKAAYLGDEKVGDDDEEEEEEEEMEEAVAEEKEEEEEIFKSYKEDKDIYQMDFSTELALADSAELLVEHLDILLANGLLEEDSKTIIQEALKELSDPMDRVKMAIYLLLISPDYAILK